MGITESFSKEFTSNFLIGEGLKPVFSYIFSNADNVLESLTKYACLNLLQKDVNFEGQRGFYSKALTCFAASSA